ncbi:hypothetical protein D3C80_1537600 [compost metagenome]
MDPVRGKTRRQGAAYAPDVGDFQGRQQGRAACRVREVADAVELGPLLGQVVGGLGEDAGRAEADAGGNAGPAQDGVAHPSRVRDRIRGAGQIKEALVDGIDLDLIGELLIDGVHAPAHVAVEGVVG